MGNNLRERATGTGVQRQEQKTLQGEIQRMESQFQMAMPKGQEATRLVRDALTCLRQTPKLQECQWSTVMGSLMTCAQLGLRPGVLGHAYLLPFWNSKAPRPDGRGEGAYQAQLVLGYQGLIELAYRSGMVESIAARTVYSNDEFLVEYGSDPKWIHRPALGGSRGEPILFYAEAKMRGGGYVFTDPMTVADMETYRDKHATAKAKNGRVFGPWVDHFEGMAHKTMVRKLMKMLPKSTEVAQAITHDGAVRIDPTPAGIDATPDYIDGTVEEDTAASADSTPAEGNQDTGSGNPPQEQQPPADPYADVPHPADEPTSGGGDAGTAAQPKPPTKAKLTKLDQLFASQGYAASDGSREEWLSNLLGDQITSVRDLSATEVDEAIAVLSGNQK